MLVLLPPSESKQPGGNGPPLDLGALSFPALTPVRERLLAAVADAARRDPDGTRSALGLSARQAGEVRRNARLLTAPTLPALRRYTGVVYDNLDYTSLRAGARQRADRSLVVASALFGLLRPHDQVPAYRLSGDTRLPGVGGLATMWRPALEPELARHRGLVIDLRSGAYAALARVPHGIEVRVLRDWGGRRSVVSHDNKWTKGLLARALCEHGARSVRDVIDIGRTVADDVEADGRRVDLLLRGLASARGQRVAEAGTARAHAAELVLPARGAGPAGGSRAAQAPAG